MMKVLIHKWTHVFILLGLLTAAVVFSGSDNDIRKRLQYIVFDGYNKLYPRAASDEIMIVDLDENSLRRIGQWPWSRDTMAELILKLKSLGARVVAFDIVFAEEDRTSPVKLIGKLPQDIDITPFGDLADNDQIFAGAIKETGNVVTGFTSARANQTRRLPHQPVPITFLMKNKEEFIQSSYRAQGIATNLSLFSANAAGNGHFMVEPEIDGLIRQVPLFAQYDPKQFLNGQPILYPSLALETLRVSIDPKARTVIKNNKAEGLFDSQYQVKIGQYDIPVDMGSKLWVHYRSLEREEYIPAYKVLDDKYLNDIQDKIKDKIILLGTSAEGLRDIRSTPLNQFVAGVEVHFNMIEQVLQGRFLKRPNFVIGAEAVSIGLIGAVIIALSPFVHLAFLGFVTLVAIGIKFFLSWYGFLEHGLLFDPVYPSIILFLLFITSSLLSYLRSEADRRQVKTAFGHYISPVFMEELTKSPDKLKLGGEVRDLTVMFTDIRGFTKISEDLSPEALIQLMNDFLTPMSDLVMESRGTIDKYMGDAMMAFWNAPLDDPDHAYQACVTALRMNEALKPINEAIEARAKEQGREPKLLSAGIGINTGPCSVGNMGSKQRFAYSALGDAVNLASRLEGQTKYYGVDTLIGEDTYKKVPDLAMLELDLVQVIGRGKPVKVYTLIGDQDVAGSGVFKQWQAAHNAMLAAYRIADFSCAAQDCKEARDFANGQLQEYYDLYQERIIEFTKTPPKDDWNGVYVATSK